MLFPRIIGTGLRLEKARTSKRSDSFRTSPDGSPTIERRRTATMVNRKSVRLSIFYFRLAPFFLLAACTPKPRYKKDQGYPDYNRLEMRPKPKPVAPVADPAPAPTLPPSRPSLNSPVNLPSGIDEAPQPPPTVVPSKGGSEPELPDDMMNTLIPGATTQK